MADDYKDASMRHLTDAETLYQQPSKRLANASHLFGLSAECSMKAIIQKNSPTKKFSGQDGHIPNVFSELQNISPIGSGASTLSGDVAKIIKKFSGWRVAQRYENQSLFLEQTTKAQMEGAQSANQLMNNYLHGGTI